jgi:hypothetical protein
MIKATRHSVEPHSAKRHLVEKYTRYDN